MIFVDSNRQVIDYSNDLSVKLRECAEKRRELFHYCSIDVARKILQTQKLFFKCVNEYTSYADKYEIIEMRPFQVLCKLKKLI